MSLSQTKPWSSTCMVSSQYLDSLPSAVHHGMLSYLLLLEVLLNYLMEQKSSSPYDLTLSLIRRRKLFCR